jgi:hypothetical protein
MELTTQGFPKKISDKYTWLKLFTLNFSPLISTKGFVLFLSRWIELVYALPFIILRREILTSSEESITRTILQPFTQIWNILIHLELIPSSSQYGQQFLFYIENRYLAEAKKEMPPSPTQFNIFQHQNIALLKLGTKYLQQGTPLILQKSGTESYTYRLLKEQLPPVKLVQTVEGYVQYMLNELSTAYRQLLLTGYQAPSLSYKSLAIGQHSEIYLPIEGIPFSGKYGQQPLFYIGSRSLTEAEKNIYPSWTQFSIFQPHNMTLLDLRTNYLSQGKPLILEKSYIESYPCQPLEEPSSTGKLLQIGVRGVQDMQKESQAAYRPWPLISYQVTGLSYKSPSISQPSETYLHITQGLVTNVINLPQAIGTGGGEKSVQATESHVGDIGKELLAGDLSLLLTSYQIPGLSYKAPSIGQTGETYLHVTKGLGTNIISLSRAIRTGMAEKSVQSVESQAGDIQNELPATARPLPLTSYQIPGLDYKSLAISHTEETYLHVMKGLGINIFNKPGDRKIEEETVHSPLLVSCLDFINNGQIPGVPGPGSPWGGVLPIKEMAYQRSRSNAFEPVGAEPIYHTYPEIEPMKSMEPAQTVKKEKVIENAAPQKPPQFSKTDMDRLTDEVYRLLERKIRIEKERRGL